MCACRVVKNRHVAIIERFGRFHKVAEPGLHFLWPGVDQFRPLNWKTNVAQPTYGNERAKYVKFQESQDQVCLNERLFDFPYYSIFTRDNVSLGIRCVMMYRITDIVKCMYSVSDVSLSVERLVLSMLRGLVGSMGLDDALASRTELTRSLLESVSRLCLSWGVEVISFHVIEINPTTSIQNAMHEQISSERLRRAEIVSAKGYRNSQKLETEGDAVSSVVLAKAEAKVKEIEAYGEAQAQVTIAQAEAESLNILREVLKDINVDPVQYMLATKYMDAIFQVIGSSKNDLILPMQLDLGGTLRELEIYDKNK